jgi:hypothetical protein
MEQLSQDMQSLQTSIEEDMERRKKEEERKKNPIQPILLN